MPKIFEYLGIVFMFYSDEHLPIHVHVQYQEFENKMEFIFENGKLVDIKIKKVRGRMPLPIKKLNEAISFSKRYYPKIASKWNDFFVLRKPVKTEKITKKIN